MNYIKPIKDRMLGCLYGQAIGDALGLGSEFMSQDEVIQNYPNGLKTYDQIIQDAHRRRWAKGAWTDDTDMMLCILNGFEDGKFDLQHVASNFKEWVLGATLIRFCAWVTMLNNLKCVPNYGGTYHANKVLPMAH